MRRAVIDVGSGSVVVVIGERTEAGWRVLDSASEMTFLGEGVKQTGILGESGIVRTLAALQAQFTLANSYDAEIVAAGTMALRIAANRDEFFRRADAQGTPVVLMSAEDEAKFGFLAVANDPLFSHQPRIGIVDPGGQSTEIVVANRVGNEWEFEHRQSYPIGTLQLRGGILASETPDVSDVFLASVQLDETLGILPRIGEGIVIALGAPGTDLIGIRDRLSSWQPEHVHGAYLDYEEVGKAVGWLMRMTNEERRHVGPLEAGREQTIHAGTLILERCLNALAAPGCYVSIRGWRNALLENPEIPLQS
jgi:exopolyphosphatase/guanosine-5'-triphosphate,3'-diphosphate pyrophosphatase